MSDDGGARPRCCDVGSMSRGVHHQHGCRLWESYAARAQGLGFDTPPPTVDVDTSRARAALRRVQRALDALAGRRP